VASRPARSRLGISSRSSGLLPPARRVFSRRVVRCAGRTCLPLWPAGAPVVVRWSRLPAGPQPAGPAEVPAPAIPPLVRLAVEEAPVIVARCPGCGSRVRSRRLAGSASDEWSFCAVCGLSRLLPSQAWRLARPEDLEEPAAPAAQLELF